MHTHVGTETYILHEIDLNYVAGLIFFRRITNQVMLNKDSYR
jgi:hypothetical protein